VLNRHCAYYAAFLRERELDLWGLEFAETLTELDNVRAAWRWAVERRKVPEIRRCLQGTVYLDRILAQTEKEQSAYAGVEEALRPKEGQEVAREHEIAWAVALSLYAFDAYFLGIGEPQAWAQQSVSILRRLGARRELAYAINAAAAMGCPDDRTQRRRLVEESLAISRELGNLPPMLWALRLLGHEAMQRGAYGEAEARLQEILRVSRRAASGRSDGYVLATLGHMARARGELDRARKYHQEALALFAGTDLVETVGRLHSHLGDLAMAVRDLDLAREHHQHALAAYVETGTNWMAGQMLFGGSCGIPVSHQTLGDIALAAGDEDEARRHYWGALDLAGEHPVEPLQLHLLLGPAKLLVQAKDPERAAELAALARDHPASVEETKDKAGALLDQLRSEIAPDVFAAAEERGRARDLNATVEELLEVLGRKQ
jgi:tetratricopeptide (TPR) repeat protein